MARVSPATVRGARLPSRRASTPDRTTDGSQARRKHGRSSTTIVVALPPEDLSAVLGISSSPFAYSKEGPVPVSTEQLPIPSPPPPPPPNWIKLYIFPSDEPPEHKCPYIPPKIVKELRETGMGIVMDMENEMRETGIRRKKQKKQKEREWMKKLARMKKKVFSWHYETHYWSFNLGDGGKVGWKRHIDGGQWVFVVEGETERSLKEQTESWEMDDHERIRRERDEKNSDGELQPGEPPIAEMPEKCDCTMDIHDFNVDTETSRLCDTCKNHYGYDCVADIHEFVTDTHGSCPCDTCKDPFGYCHICQDLHEYIALEAEVKPLAEKEPEGYHFIAKTHAGCLCDACKGLMTLQPPLPLPPLPPPAVGDYLPNFSETRTLMSNDKLVGSHHWE